MVALLELIFWNLYLVIALNLSTRLVGATIRHLGIGGGHYSVANTTIDVVGKVTNARVDLLNVSADLIENGGRLFLTLIWVDRVLQHA